MAQTDLVTEWRFRPSWHLAVYVIAILVAFGFPPAIAVELTTRPGTLQWRGRGHRRWHSLRR
jgi:hypothetical protein